MGSDVYRDVCKALHAGTLITVNDAAGEVPSYGEMEVDYVKDSGEVYLDGLDGGRYRIYHHPEWGPRIQTNRDDGRSKHEGEVVTIEIVGVEDA